MEFKTHVYYMRDGKPVAEYLEKGAKAIRDGAVGEQDQTHIGLRQHHE